MNINYKQVSKLNSFNGVKLRGNETFDELLEIERDRKAQDLQDLMSTNCNEKERLERDKANIQRVDAQVKKYKK
tara:strand:- start:288 stop:509 length:222 start_codon:yes stop_codon:yes gene_type:complete